MPIWAAVLIALASGLLGTMARISYERTAEMRTRAIEAADEFAVATVRSFELVWKATDLCEEEDSSASGAVREAKEAAEDLERRGTRLHLLIGPYTEPSFHANEVFRQLKIALASLEPWPPRIDLADLDPEDDRGEVIDAKVEDEISEARMWEGYALDEFQLFKISTARYLHSNALMRRIRRPWRERSKQPWRREEKVRRDYPYGKPSGGA
jgi:hypothetical protein